MSAWGECRFCRTAAPQTDPDRDGSVVYRCWRLTNTERVGSPDGRLMVDEDWNVYALLPRANWPLLALCQSVLAIPLLLPWLALLCARSDGSDELCGLRCEVRSMIP